MYSLVTFTVAITNEHCSCTLSHPTKCRHPQLSRSCCERMSAAYELVPTSQPPTNPTNKPSSPRIPERQNKTKFNKERLFLLAFISFSACLVLLVYRIGDSFFIPISKIPVGEIVMHSKYSVG